MIKPKAFRKININFALGTPKKENNQFSNTKNFFFYFLKKD